MQIYNDPHQKTKTSIYYGLYELLLNFKKLMYKS